MEKDSTRDDRKSQQPTAAEARYALRQLGADGEKLSARAATPRQFAPAIALVVAGFVVAQALPLPCGLFAIAMGSAAIAILVTRVSTNSGVGAAQFRSLRGKRLYVAGAAAAIACLAAGLAIKVLELSPWWVLIPAVIAFCAVLFIARASARLTRGEFVDPHTPSA